MTSDLEYEAEKSPETLEREIDEKRANIDHLVDSLESKFTPGQLFDQVLTYTKGNGGAFFQNLGATVKNNPVPAVLTTVGLAWLAMGQGRPAPQYPVRTGPGLGEKLQDMKGKATDAIGRATDAVGKVGDQLHQSSDSLRHRAHDWQDKAGEASDSFGQRVSDSAQRASDAAHRAGETAVQAKDQFGNLLKEQPLLMAAIGIALGAAIGGAIPSTRKESELMGEASDRLTSKVKAQSAAAYEQVKTEVKEAAQPAQEGSDTGPEGQPTAPAAQSGTTELSDGLGFPPKHV